MPSVSESGNAKSTFFRRWGRRALLEVGYLVFLVVLLEVTLRLAGGIWLLSRTWVSPAPAEHETAFRILTIGESTTFGQGVDPGQAYPKQLEDLLNSRLNGDYRVINTGVPGQTSTSILRNIRFQIEANRPDLVLALFGINDTNEALNDLSARVAFGVTVPEWVTRLRTYRLACIVRDFALHHPKIENHGAWVFFDREQKTEDGEWIENPFYLEQLKRNSAEIIRMTRESGCEYVMLSYLRSNDFIRGALSEIARENRVTFIDLYREESDRDSLFLADGFHPNPEGHRLMAERIFDGLIGAGIVDVASP